MKVTLCAAFAAIAMAAASPSFAQSADPAARVAAQTEAMKPLGWMDGVWRGPAWTILPTGERREVTQTERIGPLLGGSIKLLEGRGYMPDGSTGFNAFAALSFEPRTGAFTLHSYAQGYAGDFPLKPTADGYVWEIPAGPGAIIRYTAVLKDGTWTETGERIAGASPPVKFFQMTLRRVSDSAWPGAGAISPK